MQHDGPVAASSRVWLYAVSALIALFLVLPVAIIVPMSFTDAALLKFPPPSTSLRWYRAFFHSEQWMEAARTSIIVAIGTVAVATPVGTLAAYAMTRGRNRLSEAIWAVAMAPLVVPVILVAVGLYFTYAVMDLNQSLTGIILAHSMHAVPYVFVTVHSALQTFDADQPRVAQSLGASPAFAFWTVTLPQIRMAVVAAAFLAFLASFDEVVIALFISGGTHTTLTKVMFQELRLSLDPTIAAVSSLMLAVAIVVVLVSQYAALRKPRYQ